MKKSAIEVIKHLQDHGYEAVFAGGCVRDHMMGRVPNDYDIATNARPQDVENIFGNTLPIGKSFGVIQVKHNNYTFEVATFRTDSELSDGRRPDSVEFSTMQEDAARRDFTINAMFYDPIKEYTYDFYGGTKDIEDRLIRFVGSPRTRIEEDKLRILRAVRFSLTLNFNMDPTTLHIITCYSELVKEVSAERIRDEINKMLTHSPSITLHMLNSAGLLEHILPEIKALEKVAQSPNHHPEGNAFAHIYKCLSIAPGLHLDVKWAILLHDVGKSKTMTVGDDGIIHFYKHHEVGAPIAEEILKRLKFSNKFIEKVVWLVRNHMKLHFAPNMKKSKLKRLLGEKWIDELIVLHYADKMGSNRNLDTINFISRAQKTIPIEEIKPEKLINGDDLISLGFKAGRIFKEILEYIEELQLEGELSTKEEALAVVKDKYYEE